MHRIRHPPESQGEEREYVSSSGSEGLNSQIHHGCLLVDIPSMELWSTPLSYSTGKEMMIPPMTSPSLRSRLGLRR